MIVSKMTAGKKAFFDYPDDANGASFEITVLTPGQQRDINSKVQRILFKEGSSGGGMELNTNLAGHLRATAALTGWENVFDTDEDKAAGRAMKFTATNKQRMLNGVPGFEPWILEKLQELTEAHEADLEAERKNLAA